MPGALLCNLLSIGRTVDEKTQRRQVGIEPMSRSWGRQRKELEEACTAISPTEPVRLMRLYFSNRRLISFQSQNPS